MFWGLIMEPQRRYTQQVKKAFHISMAAMDISTSGDEPAQVMCGFEGRNYLLCTLRKPDILQCSLDLDFEVGSEVSFAANGKCHVHLTGHLIDNTLDLDDDDDEEDEEEEVELMNDDIKTRSKKRAQKAEDEPTAKKAKKGKVTSSQGWIDADNDDGESSDDEFTVQDLLTKELSSDDEDDNTFAEEEDDEDDSEEEEDADEEEGASEDGEEEEDVADEDSASSLSDESEEEEMVKKKPTPKMNGVTKDTPKKQQQSETEQKQKQKTPKNEKNESDKTPGKIQGKPKKQTLTGGVVVEEIREGSGAPVKNGKFVTVYYEGRLRQNNKMFDSCTKGTGFTFHFGHGEVIKAWDIGLAGMKQGGKRKIMCPPATAYGQKGSPPAIPPNSTLVFEVEVKKVS